MNRPVFGAVLLCFAIAGAQPDVTVSLVKMKETALRHYKHPIRTPMNKLRFKIEVLLLIAALSGLLSGCATNQDSSQETNDQTTISGYVDTGAQKPIK